MHKPSKDQVREVPPIQATTGIDLGDHFSACCAIDLEGRVRHYRLKTTRSAFERHFQRQPSQRIVVECGTHSAWVAELLHRLGHEVLVANPRRLRLISQSRRKDDRADAETLARLGRVDPALLAPIRQGTEAMRRDRSTLRTHDALIAARTALINHVRSFAKSYGERVPACSAPALARRARAVLSPDLLASLADPLELIADLTARIRARERALARWADQRYPQSKLLRQVAGVGARTAVQYMLKIEDPRRFAKSRTVGAYLGLVPSRRRSGDSDPHLRITKQGDPTLRRLLVGSAQYILGPFGADCDLRRYGLRLAERGGKAGKRKAVVAVARHLAVLLHRLWTTAEVYEPLRQRPAEAA